MIHANLRRVNSRVKSGHADVNSGCESGGLESKIKAFADADRGAASSARRHDADGDADRTGRPSLSFAGDWMGA